MVWFIMFLVLGGLLYAIIKQKQQLKERGVLGTVFVKHIEGIPFTPSGALVPLYLYNDKITVGDKYSIPLNTITNVTTKTENDVSEKERSVIGRALVGGVLLGPVGAVVGGMTGAKNKKEVKHTEYIVIDFKNQDETIKSMFAVNNGWSAISFMAKVTEQIRSNNITHIQLTNS